MPQCIIAFVKERCITVRLKLIALYKTGGDLLQNEISYIKKSNRLQRTDVWIHRDG